MGTSKLSGKPDKMPRGYLQWTSIKNHVMLMSSPFFFVIRAKKFSNLENWVVSFKFGILLFFGQFVLLHTQLIINKKWKHQFFKICFGNEFTFINFMFVINKVFHLPANAAQQVQNSSFWELQALVVQRLDNVIHRINIYPEY